TTVARAIWIAVLLILIIILLGTIALAKEHVNLLELSVASLRERAANSTFLQSTLGLFWAFALVLPALGGGDALALAAQELAPPRLKALRRTSLLVGTFAFILTVFSSFLFIALVPSDQAGLWAATPLSGLAQHVFLPIWARGLMTLLVLAAAVGVLIPAA